MEITEAAAAKLKEIIKEEKKGACLRVFMTSGCCGPSVAMDLADGPDKDDTGVVKDGLKVYVHKDAAVQLANAVIDCDKDGSIIVTGLPGHDCGCGH